MGSSLQDFTIKERGTAGQAAGRGREGAEGFSSRETPPLSTENPPLQAAAPLPLLPIWSAAPRAGRLLPARPESAAPPPPPPPRPPPPPPPPPLQLPSSSKRPSAAREGGGESPCPVCFSLPSPILSRPSGHHGPLNCPEATGVGWGGGSSDDARGAVSGPGRCSSPLSACSPAAIRFGTFGPRGSRQL